MEFASTKEFVTLIFEHMFLFFIDCHEISIPKKLKLFTYFKDILRIIVFVFS